MSSSHSAGFILIVVMLFLSILSLLTFGLLEGNLLENKMSEFYHSKVQSFYLAEKYLLQAEQQILNGEGVTSAVIALVDDSNCGVKIYFLTATANYQKAKTILRSTLAKIGDTNACISKPNITSGRQAFWVENF